MRPGVSIKKCVADLYLLKAAVQLMRQNKASNFPYTLVHGVEEAAGIGWILMRLFKIPYIYDMDSHLSELVRAKWWWVGPGEQILKRIESQIMCDSLATIAVCDSLAKVAYSANTPKVVILRDFAIPSNNSQNNNHPNIQSLIQAPADSMIVLYVGNFEPYQGTDLLVQAWQNINENAHLVLIGGTLADIERTKNLIRSLPSDAQNKIHLLGPRPLPELPYLLAQADILVSPRRYGTNTPMKLYSYLAAGKPIIATAIESHLQIIDNQSAVLTEVSSHALAEGINSLLNNPVRCKALGEAAKNLADNKYSQRAFRETLISLYSSLLNIKLEYSSALDEKTNEESIK
jgi:glycosyltransferase involved in cell wall biosynthesis